MTARRIAIYGKGGIGKSTVATSLSMVFALAGRRVLHVGCDPKADSSLRLIDGQAKPHVLDVLLDRGRHVTVDDILSIGRHGVEFIEAGGPEPGSGCAGRGVAVMIERLEQLDVIESRSYDVVLYDVLGDVVCGGFAAPLRRGVGQHVYIVTSEEPMSLYAANNIARAVARYSRNGIVLGGVIANLHQERTQMAFVESFAARIGTEVVASLTRDPLIRRAEHVFTTVVELAPQSPSAVELRRLAGAMYERFDDLKGHPPRPPTPLEQREFMAFVRDHTDDQADRSEDDVLV